MWWDFSFSRHWEDFSRHLDDFTEVMFSGGRPASFWLTQFVGIGIIVFAAWASNWVWERWFDARWTSIVTRGVGVKAQSTGDNACLASLLYLGPQLQEKLQSK